MKRTPIQRKTPIKRAPAPTKRTAKPKSRGREPGFSDDVKALTRRIQGHRCGVCRGPIEHFHHRKLRGHGDHTFVNCLGLCAEHHHLAHNDKISWAYRHGIMLRSFHDPAKIPVFLTCSIHCPIDHVAALDDEVGSRAS